MVLSARGQRKMGAVLRHGLGLSGAKRPKLCFIETASGDNDANLRADYAAVAGEEVDPSHLALFPMPNIEDVAGHLLAQDVIWVGGGSVANLLALWRLHRLDEILAAAWEKGVVLAGVSAGSICWHRWGTTDSFGPELSLVDNGLGFLPYGNGVHYDSEVLRRPLVRRLVAQSELPRCFATDDGVGLHYIDTELVEAVSQRPGASAWKIERDETGAALETALPTRLLT
jgi:peptidase E